LIATVDLSDSGADERLVAEASTSSTVQWWDAGTGVTGRVRGHSTDACSETGTGGQETIGHDAAESAGNSLPVSVSSAYYAVVALYLSKAQCVWCKFLHCIHKETKPENF